MQQGDSAAPDYDSLRPGDLLWCRIHWLVNGEILVNNVRLEVHSRGLQNIWVIVEHARGAFGSWYRPPEHIVRGYHFNIMLRKRDYPVWTRPLGQETPEGGIDFLAITRKA